MSSFPSSFNLPSASFSRLLPWLQPFSDVGAINDLIGLVDPLWSLDSIRARIERIIIETDNTRTLILQPNGRWTGFRAGQHVVVEVEIDGVRHHRSYSLSSAPGDSRLAITVKRQPNGKISNWIHERATIGSILTLSAPTGAFTLPDVPPPRLMMIGAGSGMTPLMSIIRDLHARFPQAEQAPAIILLHVCRNEADAIFGHELIELADRWPALELVWHFTESAGRLDKEQLRRLLPHADQYQTLLCGPASFIGMVAELWRELDIADRLEVEHFGLAPSASTTAIAGVHQVFCGKSERSFDSNGQPLLLEAERAGLSPKHGCRIGICRSCQCRKLSGTTENLLTGEICSEPDQLIQLCISAARTDLQLDL